MSMRFSFGLIFLSVQAGVASSAPLDTTPIVDVRLAPPLHPLPQVSSEIDRLDNSRETLEAEQGAALSKLFDTTAERANIQIRELIEHFMSGRTHSTTVKMQKLPRDADMNFHTPAASSFLVKQKRETSNIQDVVLKVNVFRSAGASPSTVEGIAAVERKRAAEELDMFNQASLEMHHLTKIVLHELEAQLLFHAESLGSYVDEAREITLTPNKNAPATMFLKSSEHLAAVNSNGLLPKLVNLRVGGAATPFPSIVSSVKGMELRRDRSEKSARAHILEMELALLQAENSMIATSLRSAFGQLKEREAHNPSR